MEENELFEGANFYAICPNCGKPIAFQGVDIQYYQPIGYELEHKLYTGQKEVMDTGKNIACPYCETISKAKDCKFVINDF